MDVFDSLRLAGLGVAGFHSKPQNRREEECEQVDHPVRSTVVVAQVATIGG